LVLLEHIGQVELLDMKNPPGCASVAILLCRIAALPADLIGSDFCLDGGADRINALTAGLM
jgi:hypothetical protein